jgi:hypothetical protein
MANHLRRQIREAAASYLTGLSTTGSRVYQSRIQPLADSKLPCLLISSDKERVEAIDLITNPMTERRLELTVRGVAKASSNLDDTLDGIAKEVEVALNATVAANTLGGLVKGVMLDSIEVDFDGQGEKPVGFITMIFTATYYARASAPDVSI